MLESVIAITGVASLIAFLTAIAHKSLTQIAWHDLEDYCRRREKEVVFDNIHDRHDSAVASTEVLQDVAVVTALFTVFRHYSFYRKCFIGCLRTKHMGIQVLLMRSCSM